MRILTSLLASLVLAICAVAIAILSVQNATPVSLSFLTFQSIQLPVGVVLGFSFAVGTIGVALIQLLWSLAGRSDDARSEDDLDDDFLREDS